MLNILRKRAQSFVIQIMVLLIAIVFIFWGVGSNLNNSGNAVAVVNDEEIPFQDYIRSYDRAVDAYRAQYGGQIPEGLLEAIGLKNQVVNQLIQTELLRQGAEKIGLMISKEEIQRRVEEMEAFHLDGRFDMAQYKEVLKRNRLTPTSFEAGLKNDLLTARATEMIGSFAEVSPQEIQAWLDYGSEEVKIAYVRFPAEDFAASVKVEEEALSAWYEENKKDYTTKPQMKLRYLYFPFVDDLDQVEVSPSDISDKYREDIDNYTVAEQRRARHILFKVDDLQNEELKAAKKSKAEEVLNLLSKGGDFSALAAEYSEGPSRDNGGDLGFFSRGEMVPEFETAVFGMETGEVIGPVETSFGYHLIQLEEIRPQTIRNLAEVENDIREELQQNRVRGITFKKASEAYEGIILAGSLDNFVEQGGAKPAETDFFTKDNPPPALADAAALLDVAASLGKGELSSLVETAGGYGIAFIADVKPPRVPELAEVRERVVADFTREESVVLAREAAETLLAEAGEESRLPEVENVQQSEYIKRSDFAGALPGGLIRAAFSLSEAEPVGKELITEDNVFYVFQLLDKRLGEEDAGRLQKDQLSGQLLADQQNRLVVNWVARLRGESKIWVNESILK